MPDLTCAELARRYKVARSTVARALAREGAPGPVNPGEPQLRYRSEEVDAFWPKRRKVGRPRRRVPPVEREEEAESSAK